MCKECDGDSGTYTNSYTWRGNSTVGGETNICVYLTTIYSAVYFCTYTAVRKHAVTVPRSAIEDVKPTWTSVYYETSPPQLTQSAYPWSRVHLNPRNNAIKMFISLKNISSASRGLNPTFQPVNIYSTTSWDYLMTCELCISADSRQKLWA